ncbi:MAG: HAD-IIA family hydrolase [Acidimicrobiia bacterium]
MTQLICCDLDGVLWLGHEPIDGSAEAINALRTAGHRVGYLTNNSSRTPRSILDQLGAMGIDAADDDVVTSAQAAATLLRERLAPGARVLACAGLGVIEALEAEEYLVVDRGPADAVVVGFHPTFDFDELDRASAAVRAGARFVATNVDATYPGADGLLPGNGAIVAAIATAAGRTPEVAGKPEAPTVALVRSRFAAELTGGPGLMVGDRPSTDGALATALGWPFALVLSGISDGDGGGEPVPTDPVPAYVIPDLAALAEQLLEEN